MPGLSRAPEMVCVDDPAELIGSAVALPVYDAFADAASTNALKDVLNGSQRRARSNGHVATKLVVGAA